MSTDTAVDPSVLQGLDFEVPCGHSQHNKDAPAHEGDAKFIAVSYHMCPAENKPSPYYYPCCAPWAEYVLMARSYGAAIQCSRCGERGLWSDFVHIIDTLT